MTRRRILIFLLFTLLTVLTVSTAQVHAITEAVACVEGVTGDSILIGFSDCIDVLEFHHLVKGLSADEHESIAFVKKRNERSTVGLLNLLHNTNNSDMIFHFVMVQAEPTVYYEVDLRNAHIMAIEPWTRNDGSDDYERVRVTYGEMRVTFVRYNPPGSPETYTLTVPGGMP